MFAKFKGLFSGPQVPADSGTTIASPAPAPAPAPPPAPAKVRHLVNMPSKSLLYKMQEMFLILGLASMPVSSTKY